MAIEQYTEHLVLEEMNIKLGKNENCIVLPQGDVEKYPKIEKALKEAGGKPKKCELKNFTLGGKGKAKPEFIITFKDNINTIIVIECKNTLKKHESLEKNEPNNYAVDGVLYYSKFLKTNYDVIGIAVSGTKKSNMKVSTFFWEKGQSNYKELEKAKNHLFSPEEYINLIKGEEVKKNYSIQDVRKLALEFHDTLRELGVTEKEKPLFIAGLLIALQDTWFKEIYRTLKKTVNVITSLETALNNILDQEKGIKKEKIDYIKTALKQVGKNEKLKVKTLGEYNSITWYIEELELKILPMMNHDTTIDALGEFYHEFIKYSGGDGNGLGIVLTPEHITDFMVELANVNKCSKVIDPTCGSGSFLVSALNKMIKNANHDEIIEIKNNSLYGIEINTDLYTLSLTNMIVRGDGKSNIENGDCFNQEIKEQMKSKNINVGLINPPYAQKDCELKFINNMLDMLVVGGIGVAIVPLSSAIGTKFLSERESLMSKHTLKAVLTMPDDLFYPTASTNTCIMVWEAGNPHNSDNNTFFGYFKDDGFVKKKKLGRIDYFNKWDTIKRNWLELYRNNDVKDGISARKKVTFEDEWLAEAYMKTDYSKISEDDFVATLIDYASFLVKNGGITDDE